MLFRFTLLLQYMLQQSKIICKKFAQNIKSIKFEAINHEIVEKEKPIAQ